MAVRTFDGVDDLITFSASFGALCNAGYSIIVITKPTTDVAGTAWCGLQVGTANLIGSLGNGAGAAGKLSLFTDSPEADAIVGFTTTDWQILGLSRPAGTSAVTFHRKILGSGTWTHAVSAATIPNDATSVSRVDVGGFLGGAFASFKSTRIAVVALFNTALSDAAVESIQTTPSTQKLFDLGAVALWDFNQASVATAVEDLVGTKDQTAITGTTVTTGDDPTGWTFGATSGDATVVAVPADATGDIPAPTVLGDPVITHDATSRSHATDALGNTTAAPFSWTHTPVGNPKSIVVAVTQPLGSTDEVSGVTYGGVAMSRVVSQARTTTEAMRVYLYHLGSGIPTGAQTVQVTSTGILAKQGHCYSAVTSDGSDTQVDASNSSDLGIIANPSLTVTHSASIAGWAGYAVHGYGGPATPTATASSAKQSGETTGFGHDPGAATAESYYRVGGAVASSSTYGYTTLASDDQVIAAVVVKPVASVPANVSAVVADGTGALVVPTIRADANVTAVPAAGTGDIPAPVVGATADATVVAVPADATGAVPVPAVIASSVVTSPAAVGTGDIPTPIVSGGTNATVVAVPAAATMDIVGNFPMSAEVAAAPAAATGDIPAPVVSAGANATVVAVPADATGVVPVPAVVAGSNVTALPAAATGDVVVPTVSGAANITAVAADSVGDTPVPTLSAGVVIAAIAADALGDIPAPVVSSVGPSTAPPIVLPTSVVLYDVITALTLTDKVTSMSITQPSPVNMSLTPVVTGATLTEVETDLNITDEPTGLTITEHETGVTIV